MNDNDYAGLKPGLYLQVGGAVKKLDIYRGDSDSWLSLFGLDRRVSIETLADKESWTFTALDKRAEQIISVPFAWMSGETELEEAPFQLNMRNLLPQIDKALQTQRNGAFLYKWRYGGQVRKLSWLDPVAMEPDIETADLENGVKRFIRKTDDGRDSFIEAKDIIWFRRPSQREIASDPSPLEASRLSSEVLYNIARMEDSFYETNGLPVMLIKVPATTSEAERNRLRDSFDMLLNRIGSPREVKTKAVGEGVEIEILSFKPNELDLEATKANHREAVLSVHSVPMSVAMSNAANYATAMSDKLQFAETMATRLEAIAETLNDDPDIAASGFTFVVKRNEMPVMQEEEAARAQALSAYVASGMHLELAMAILGVDIPEGYEGPIEAEKPEPPPQLMIPPQQPMPEQEEAEPTKSALWHTDESALKNWLKKRGIGTDVAGFKSNYLTYLDKLNIYAEVFDVVDRVYP